MPFTYNRTIRFQDTDAAGVVYFSNVLVICHEAYEESLIASGINVKAFFSNPPVAFPIVHASVDFWRPLFCGEQVLVCLIPQQLRDDGFEINYKINAREQVCAQAATQHVCIDTVSRNRKNLSSEMIAWLRRWS